MKTPPKNFTYLWNDLPKAERKRLMPYQIESQILHIWQCREKAILAHQRHMRELNAQMNNLVEALKDL